MSKSASDAVAEASAADHVEDDNSDDNQGAIHDVVTSFIVKEGGRGRRVHRFIHPRYRDTVFKYVEHVQPKKLLLMTLFEVFEHFVKSLDNQSVSPDWNNADGPLGFHFPYEKRMWRATIIGQQSSIFAGKAVHFVNIKLPNDSFVYITRYNKKSNTKASGKPTPLTLDPMNAETRKFVACLWNHIKALFKNKRVQLGKAITSYDIYEERVYVRFWDKSDTYCVALEWEYGYPEQYMDAQTLKDGKEWAKILLGEHASQE